MNRRLSALLTAVLLLGLSLPVTLAATPPPAELISAGRVDEALGILQDRLRQSPNDAEAHFLLMRAYFALQQWDRAVDQGEKAVALAPNNSAYHLWLGRSYGEKADHATWVTAISVAKKSRVELERAVQLKPNDVAARTDLAEFYAAAPGILGGGKDKALEQAEAVRKLGDEAQAHWIEARVAEGSKDYAAAEQHFKNAIAASGGRPDFILNLASFYRRRGRGDDVQRTVDQAVQAAPRVPSGPTLYDAAETLYRAGRNFERAAQLLRSYIAAPEHSEQAPVFQAHYLLGVLLQKMGDKPAAADQYRAALSLARNFEPAISALKRVQ